LAKNVLSELGRIFRVVKENSSCIMNTNHLTRCSLRPALSGTDELDEDEREVMLA
jgi:hypothetical protein